MRRILEHCTAILDRVIFIGFGVQIVLGAFWMCSAFTGLRLPVEGILCMGQILLFAGAAFFFLWTVSGAGRGRVLFGSLCLLTFPMVAQCHLTTGKASVTAALLLAETAFGLWAARKPEKKLSWCGLLCAWLALGLFGRVYFGVGIVAVVFCLFCLLRNPAGKRRFFARSVTAVLTAGAIVGAGRFCWAKSDISKCLLSRLVWTSIKEVSDQMSDEQREILGGVEVYYSTFETNGIERTLIPSMLEKADEAEVKGILRELTRLSWEKKKTKITKEILWDMVGYTAAPLVLPRHLEGKVYDSLSGKNYLQVLQPAPKLGKVYMEYGCWWFGTALAVGLILRILKWVKGKRFVNFCERTPILGMCLVLIVCFTMSGAGIMDYTKTIFVLSIWLAWIWRAGEIS